MQKFQILFHLRKTGKMAFILEEPSADLLSILTYAYCLTIQMIENYLY